MKLPIINGFTDLKKSIFLISNKTQTPFLLSCRVASDSFRQLEVSFRCKWAQSSDMWCWKLLIFFVWLDVALLQVTRNIATHWVLTTIILSSCRLGTSISIHLKSSTALDSGSMLDALHIHLLLGIVINYDSWIITINWVVDLWTVIKSDGQVPSDSLPHSQY